MNAIVFLGLCILAAVVPSHAQFALPYDAADCTAGRLYDPFLIQALKSKFPKKYSPKLDYAKDLALDAKCRLHTAKLLARHVKSLNTGSCDLQSLMYQSQQPGLLQPVVIPDQNALFAQQQQQQQQQLVNYQIPIDAARSLTLTPAADTQLTCYSQFADPRFQQLQLTGAQRYRNGGSGRRRDKACSSQGCPCSCEGCMGRSSENPLSSVVSGFLGVLKTILK